MAKITYEDKEFLNKNENIADKNKVNDTDLNEIKNTVNENDDNVGDLSNLNTTDKSNLVSAINEVNDNVIVDYTFTQSTNEVTFDNLELIPGIDYKISIIGTVTANSDLYLKINEYVDDGYYQLANWSSGSNTTSDANLSYNGGYRPNKNGFYYNHLVRPKLTTIDGTLRLALNEDDQYYPQYCWKCRCIWRGYQFNSDGFGILGYPVEKITKLTFLTPASKFNVGTKIKIYKYK